MANWTKKEVQRHARVAVAIELYTIPFYTTVMTSIKDEQSDVYKIIRGVLIEEMMHMQLAANLCVALDTIPLFQIPNYDLPVVFLNPGATLDADMGPLDNKSISAMLAIETPEPASTKKLDAEFPYSSIGEMYAALLDGIQKVGVGQFSWTASNQQERWATQGYSQIIKTIVDAKEAVKAIGEQGEGRETDIAIPTPHTPSNFPVDMKYQMNNSASSGAPYKASPILYKELSHYGRFLKIKLAGLPPVYTGIENATHLTNKVLQRKFAAMMSNLNALWMGGVGVISQDALWLNTLEAMRESAQAARACWEAGVIPNWTHIQLPSVP